eukprot:gnl/TRDRNA2_/TRDRNA2_175699_c0_seq5.p1 gnl/TRDRNA2_/TRDRNA2_175699_c0~~gnl/TRDRNA2_/TRDRNA2_175699_c0_seq5.p1  ORF type:complete len:405 (+),score=84.57 gnl/TRDRNA2_/TRDRNA2_175699_c0_seq5:41-1255(+)
MPAMPEVGGAISENVVDLKTTVIGSYPKPSYLKIPDFFNSGDVENKAGLLGAGLHEYNAFLKSQTEESKQELEKTVIRACKEVIAKQCECGVDIVTDGEIRRENYLHYLCRFIEGISFEAPKEKSVRNGAYTAILPVITGKVSWRGGISCAEEWKKAQACAPEGTHVKYTLPGPMTLIGSLEDAYYKNDAVLAEDLAKIVNMHVLELVEAGCKYIQIDECMFARKPDDCLAFGVRTLNMCFDGVKEGSIEKTMHMCCGYPGHVDQTDYPKADQSAYFKIAPALDKDSCLDWISIEDAWCRNDLTLLSLFKNKKVILGTMNVSSSRVEEVGEMRSRLTEALKYIEPERLMVAPDCGLALLQGEKYGPLLEKKLKNMCLAAKGIPYTRKRACEGQDDSQSPKKKAA